jgi:hypothetical protein
LRSDLDFTKRGHRVPYGGCFGRIGVPRRLHGTLRELACPGEPPEVRFCVRLRHHQPVLFARAPFRPLELLPHRLLVVLQECRGVQRQVQVVRV